MAEDVHVANVYTAGTLNLPLNRAGSHHKNNSKTIKMHMHVHTLTIRMLSLSLSPNVILRVVRDSSAGVRKQERSEWD